jgi:hypothetical protein
MSDEKMRASKETAREAYRRLGVITSLSGDLATSPAEDERVADAKKYLLNFLSAAERKLPSEEAYLKEKKRKLKHYHVKKVKKATRS